MASWRRCETSIRCGTRVKYIFYDRNFSRQTGGQAHYIDLKNVEIIGNSGEAGITSYISNIFKKPLNY